MVMEIGAAGHCGMQYMKSLQIGPATIQVAERLTIRISEKESAMNHKNALPGMYFGIEDQGLVHVLKRVS